ncbi:MAG TPA: glycosyltransferase family 4 protein [Candidatus Binatia bacterium]|jgi:glycosyltransferase involved in cell wall biosynthesis|nr:glycosyltransferase family 4 protein [Candidatus Binatia bacterium]
MQMTDSLNVGGAERVAVNLANYLPRDLYDNFLCTTRREGPLAGLIAPDVGRLQLARKWRFDPQAIRRLVEFVRSHEIQILHAHGTAVFIAAAAAHFPPYPVVVWHDHFGRYAVEQRPAWLYRLAVSGIGAVIAVNEPLAEWSRAKLRIPAQRVWYVPNFVGQSESNGHRLELPGKRGKRIVCIANFRPEKDHLTLLHAMSLVRHSAHDVHLILVGQKGDPSYFEVIQREIIAQGLSDNVSVLGPRTDVLDILRACDIGVLSSRSEGLPLALIEYGITGLPSVATQVGQCGEVLEEGRSGVLVPPADPRRLAEAISSILCSSDRRAMLGKRFKQWVEKRYNPKTTIRLVSNIYRTLVPARYMGARVHE